MPSKYSFILLGEVFQPGLPERFDSGVRFYTSPVALSNYDVNHSRLQIAGSTSAQTRNDYITAAGYWELDRNGLPNIDSISVPLGAKVTDSSVNGINNTYPAVKVGTIEENKIRKTIPVMWTTSGMRKLGSFGGKYGSARGINDAGHIVGYSLNVSDDNRAFLWIDNPLGDIKGQSRMRDLGTLGGKNSSAVAINSKDQVTGWAEDENGTRHAFVWTPGGTDGVRSNPQMKPIDISPGFSCKAYDINDDGNIVGSVQWSRGNRPFFWSADTGPVLLETLGGDYGWASAINNKNEIVGSSMKPGSNTTEAVRWTNFNIANLNDEISNSFSPWHLLGANDINSDGDIVCIALKGKTSLPALLSELAFRANFIPPLYRRLFPEMDAGSAGNGNFEPERPLGPLEKVKEDADLLMMMARTSLTLHDKELSKKFYTSLFKSGTKKTEKIIKRLKKKGM